MYPANFLTFDQRDFFFFYSIPNTAGVSEVLLPLGKIGTDSLAHTHTDRQTDTHTHNVADVEVVASFL